MPSIAAQRRMKEQWGPLLSLNRRKFPANLQVFPVDFVRKRELLLWCSYFDACTPKRGEGGRNACAFAGTGLGSDFLREMDVQMQ
ncbi:hypothetical protein VK70_20075 [Paenibacillus durus ATCC 35681]|uniref:Uncharacterized protein n=1 Tax=Paenibacillus durus ATCC 35681 TaxID=1333534 RepID=A0A0F7FCR3_PAEDU|nr:hypothetical protein VK70_20075 [Paenibacillus durus ATCC 35681]